MRLKEKEITANHPDDHPFLVLHRRQGFNLQDRDRMP